MDWRKTENKQFVKALLCLRTAEEAETFLRDLLTEEEIVEFAKRLQTAELLSANVPYTEIQTITGLSSTTIARVSKWLQAQGGGYRLVIDRLNHHHTSAPRGRGLR
jgi:TrpR-related protein YerC/YecD